MVAPHAGAWIETNYGEYRTNMVQVAPHAGAWIETDLNDAFTRSHKSPPMRGRGLKLPSQGRSVEP